MQKMTKQEELARRKRLKALFDSMEGLIKYDGTACDLLREIRKKDCKLKL